MQHKISFASVWDMIEWLKENPVSEIPVELILNLGEKNV